MAGFVFRPEAVTRWVYPSPRLVSSLFSAAGLDHAEALESFFVREGGMVDWVRFAKRLSCLRVTEKSRHWYLLRASRNRYPAYTPFVILLRQPASGYAL